MNTLVFRLLPGEDLLLRLRQEMVKHHIEAAVVLSSVGCLTSVNIRPAGEEVSCELVGKFEILTLNGTLATTGEHLHIAVADKDMQTFGGHLMEKSIIFTTAEIVLGVLPDITFARTYCPLSGYEELDITWKGEKR